MIIGVISVRGPWLCGLGILGGEIVVTVTPPQETLVFGMPHLLDPVTIILLESGGVGTADDGTGREFICCEELSLVILLCRPPTDPPKEEIQSK